MKAIRTTILSTGIFLLAATLLVLFDADDPAGPAADPTTPVESNEQPVTSGDELPRVERSDRESDPVDALTVREAVVSEADKAQADLPPDQLVTAEVRIRVEEEAGTPIAGASVSLATGMASGGAIPVLFQDFALEETTDDDGRAVFPVPRVGVFTLTVIHEGFAGRTMSPVLPTDDLVLTLGPGLELKGRLVDETSEKPVAGATVRVRREVVEQRQLIEPMVVTDAAGDFRVVDLAAGTYRVEILAEGYDVEQINGVLVEEGVGDLATIPLIGGVALEGVVIDSTTRSPIGGARVEVSAERRQDGETINLLPQSTTTDQEGRFAFESVSRSGVALNVRADGYAAWREGVKVVPEEHESTLEVELHPGSTVSGTVVTMEGAAVAGASVSLSGLDRDAVSDRTVETDEEGVFTFTAVRPWSKFDLVAASASSGLAPSVLDEMLVEEGQSLNDLEVVLEYGATVTGQILDVIGEPVPYAHVLIEDVSSRIWFALDQSPLQFADAEGQFEVQGLPTGLIHLTARSGECYSPTMEFSLIGGLKHEVTLVLEQGQVLIGYVVEKSGAPIEGALVTAFAIDPEFKMPSLPKTKVKSAAPSGRGKGGGKERGKKKGGAKAVAAKARATQKAEQRRTNARLKELAKFQSRQNLGRMFRAATGGRLRTLTAYRAMDRTNEQGRFILSGLDREEKLALVVRKEGFVSRYRYGIEPGEDPQITLPRLARLAGIVVDGRTRFPLPDFRVTATPVGETKIPTSMVGLLSRRAEVSRTFRSTDGRFVLHDLEPGVYNVTARSSGYEKARTKEVSVGESQHMDVLLELQAGSIIRGRIVAGVGSPVPSLNVYLVPSTESSPGLRHTTPAQNKRRARKVRARYRRSDQHGEYVFRDVKPGTYVVGVGSPAQPIAGPFSVMVGEGDEKEQDFRVDMVGDLVVEVRAENGFRLNGASVRLKGKTYRANYRRTADDFGKVSFENLVADEYVATVTAKGFLRQTETIVLHANDRRTASIGLKKRD